VQDPLKGAPSNAISTESYLYLQSVTHSKHFIRITGKFTQEEDVKDLRAGLGVALLSL